MTLRWLPPGLIAVVTLAAFSPTFGNGFASWDDALNFLDNPTTGASAPPSSAGCSPPSTRATTCP